jgi:hypothetical protein
VHAGDHVTIRAPLHQLADIADVETLLLHRGLNDALYHCSLTGADAARTP